MFINKKAAVTLRASFGTIFRNSKKGVGAVVAISLFLVVTIVSVIAFQNWFGNYQSGTFVDAETQSDSIEDLNIVDLVGNTLYVESEFSVDISSIQINKRDCGLTPSFTSGVNTVDVGTCLSGFSESKFDVVLVTNNGVFSEEIYSSGGFDQILFAKIFDGGGFSRGFSLIQVSDGGFGIIGYNSFLGKINFYFIRIDSFGNKLWNVSFDGSYIDYGSGLVETSDGGFGLIGRSYRGASNNYDIWLIKTDSSGNELWNVTFGNIGFDSASKLIESSDGGFLFSGSKDNGIDSDCWLIKTDSFGNELWNVSFNTGSYTSCGSLVETDDGGFALIGSSHNGVDYDYWLLKIDSNNNEQWNVSFDSNLGEDYGISGIGTTDGGFAIFGYIEGAIDDDYWLVKTDSSGNELWNVSFDSGGRDWGSSLVETNDGGLGLLGSNLTSAWENADVWLIKVNSTGDVLWNETYDGGYEDDFGYFLTETIDGGLCILGGIENASSLSDVWLIKTNSTGGTCDYSGDGEC